MLAIEPLACCKRFFFNSGVACRLSSGPLAEDRGKVLAIEAIKAPGRFGSIARGCLGKDRGKMLTIEAPHGARWAQKGGSTQANATEALLLLGPRLKIEENHAPLWRPDGPRRGVNPAKKLVACFVL